MPKMLLYTQNYSIHQGDDSIIVLFEMEKAADFDEALKNTGFGKFNIALIFISGACLFTVNADAYSMGYLLPSAQCDLNLSTFDKGILSSVSFVGIISSSHLWGFLADTKGRRIVCMITLIASFICTLLASFVVNFWVFAFLRYLSGFFIAGASGTIYAYLGEFHGDKHRTIAISVASVFIASAIAALPGVAWVVIPQTWTWSILDLFEYKPWRFFMMICSLPGVFIAMALYFFPESPKFLMQKGESFKALEVLKKVYAVNMGEDPDHFPIKSISVEYSEANMDDNDSKCSFLQLMWRQTIPLFKSPNLFNTFIVCTLQFGLFAVSSGLLLWYPEIVNNMAEHGKKNPNSSITVCEAISGVVNEVKPNMECKDKVDTSVFEQNLIIGVAYIIGITGICLIVNTFGKRTLSIVFLVLSGASGIAICWITNRIIVDYLFVGLLVLSGITVVVINAAVLELFPTYLRAMAMCISLMCGRIGSVVASSTIGILIEMNCLATFFIFSGVCFVCVILSWWIPNHSSTDQKNM